VAFLKKMLRLEIRGVPPFVAIVLAFVAGLYSRKEPAPNSKLSFINKALPLPLHLSYTNCSSQWLLDILHGVCLHFPYSMRAKQTSDFKKP